jgi:hypothetical protein
VAAAAIARLRSLIEANDGHVADAVQAVTEALSGTTDGERLKSLVSSIDEIGALSNIAKA